MNSRISTQEVKVFDRCTYLGTDWRIVFVYGDYVSLTSLDGTLFKKHIHVDQIQVHDEFKDAYPEE
jgi:hypothetical protein